MTPGSGANSPNCVLLQMVLKEIKWPWHAKNDAPFSMNLGPVHCGMITQVRWIPEQALGTKFHTPFTFGLVLSKGRMDAEASHGKWPSASCCTWSIHLPIAHVSVPSEHFQQ